MEQSSQADELLAARSEIRHLKNSLVALRSQLEATQFEGQENVQRAIAEGHDEITQLHETAVALRAELENLNHEKDQAVQEADLAARPGRDKATDPNGQSFTRRAR
jgi:DNA-binding protein H-NS